MQGKDFFDAFSKVEPVTKGWSVDKRYCVTKADGTRYLLRKELVPKEAQGNE